MAKYYKLKLEDKAALLNHLQALNINIESFDITDNKLDDTFEFTVEQPEIVNMIKQIRKPNLKSLIEKLHFKGKAWLE